MNSYSYSSGSSWSPYASAGSRPAYTPYGTYVANPTSSAIHAANNAGALTRGELSGLGYRSTPLRGRF